MDNPFLDLIPGRTNDPAPPAYFSGGNVTNNAKWVEGAQNVPIDQLKQGPVLGHEAGGVVPPNTEPEAPIQAPVANPFMDLVPKAPVQADASGGSAEGPSWSETFATAKQNMPTPGEFLKQELSSVVDPNAYWQDIKNVGKLALGLGEKAVGTDRANQYSNEQDTADQFLHHYGNYFSEKGLKENVSQDPLGTMTDVLSVALPVKGLKPGGFGESVLSKADELGAKNLKGRAATAIEDAKDSGVHFTQPFMQELSGRFRTIAEQNGYREGKHNLTKAVLKQADLMSEGLPSFRSIHNLRQDINDALKSNLDSERNIGMKMKQELDSVFTNLEKGTPEQIAQVVHAPPGTNPGQLAKNFKSGLTAYGAAKRVEEIQRIFDKAEVHGFTWSQSGLANSIKTKFRQIYANDRKLRGYSSDEKALIRDIAHGNITDQALTLLSKAAIRGPVSFIGTHVAGGGIVGQGLIAGAGELAKRALDARQVAKVERLQHHILAKGESALRDVVGGAVYDHLNGTPNGAAAIQKWIKTKGSRVATRALALTIAQSTNRTDLLPRINDELSGIKH